MDALETVDRLTNEYWHRSTTKQGPIMWCRNGRRLTVVLQEQDLEKTQDFSALTQIKLPEEGDWHGNREWAISLMDNDAVDWTQT